MKRVFVWALLTMATSAIGQPINDDVRSGQLVFSASYIHNERPWTFVLLDLKTGSQQLLADYGGGATAPTWSRDGRRLLYSLNRNCDGVYMYDVEQRRSERIDQPTEWGAGCQAAWSPDERSVAYMSTHEAHLPHFYYDLYTFDLQTKARRRLTTQSGGFPSWSPDGQWIAYYAPGREVRTFRIRPDGSGEQPFPTLTDQSLRAQAFTWSPDGKRLAFTAWTRWVNGHLTHDPRQVYTANASGRDARLLTPEAWLLVRPVWSPQLDRIALLVTDNEGYNGAIRLVEGGHSREIVPLTYWDHDSWNFWSPNGHAIAYAPLNWTTLKGRGISVLNLDDGKVVQFATDTLATYPVWRPVRR